MVFRGDNYSELCDRCRRPARGGCLRCDLPLCADHLPRRNARCDVCEAEFRETILRRETEQADDWQRRIRGNSFVSYVSVAALAGLWAKSAAKYAVIRVVGKSRRGFLAERKHKR